MSQKIVVNRCWGGFSLSAEACRLLNCEPYDFSHEMRDGDKVHLRNDPRLIKIVESLGEEAASGSHARLVVVEIPDDVGDNWFIDDYDGSETIRENHRSW